jgi:hypothetical protein|tara:strand:- start:843 stop:1046 length:204 start_codon:yes stop_codon:yes gene_type:complete
MEKIDDSSLYTSVSHVTQNLTLDNTTTGETINCNIIVDASQLVIDNGINLVIGVGKKVIPDLYNINK